MVRSYRARWLFDGSGPLLENVYVTVARGAIVRIGRSSEGPVEDLGDSLLIPMLVNAHTHLEFSQLNAPLGQPSDSFPDWIRHVVDWRRQRETATASGVGTDTPADSREPAWRTASTESGLAESWERGVAAVGEIATPGWPRQAFELSPLEGTIFLELLGLARERIEPLLALADEHLRTPRIGRNWRAGISPHAPYTVHPRLLQRACRLAAAEGAPVAMHLAESRDELELLSSGTGPLRDLLEELGAWHADAIPRGSRILDYLKLLAETPRSLIIHGNYLADDEIEFLARRRRQMAVVYCPRTHAYFGQEPYPLRRMLDAGVRVVVGTDSRASNPDLSVLAELCELAHRHPTIEPRVVLTMGMDIGVVSPRDESSSVPRVGGPFRALCYSLDSREPEPLECLLRGTVEPRRLG